MSVTDFRVASFFYDFILNSNLGSYSKFFALLLEAQKKRLYFKCYKHFSEFAFERGFLQASVSSMRQVI